MRYNKLIIKNIREGTKGMLKKLMHEEGVVKRSGQNRE
jgi:hypothetical protein